MTKEQQIKFFENFTNTMAETLLKKGNDYSNEDRLSNFKVAGAILGKTPEEVALVLIAVKVARMGQLIGTSKIPNNESIDDTLLDLANYDLLLAMIISENRLVEKDQPRKTD